MTGPAGTRTTPHEAGDTGRARILIADDEPRVREVLYDLLARDYECREVACAEAECFEARQSNFTVSTSESSSPKLTNRRVTPRV